MNVLFASLLLGTAVSGPDPTFPKPTIERVRIVGDTVWFEGTRGFDTVSTRYCFVRPTGSWCRLPHAPSEKPVGDPLPRSPRDTIALAPGLRVVCRPSDSWPESCETFAVMSSDDRRVHWLIPQATQLTRHALQRAIGLETDQSPEMSTFLTSRAIDDRAVWFGMGGGFPEGDGAFGCLLRFDRQQRTIETITHPKLANATVTGIVIEGGALWIGTVHPGEYGPWGSTAILRRDLRSGSWSQLDSATTDLPDNLIRALASADGTLYLATEDGLAAFDVKSNRWNVRYFRRTIIADSIVYALATARPTDEASDEAMFVLMQQLGVSRRAAFIAAMRQIAPERLHRVLVPTDGTFAEALAHPALVPFLVEALANPQASILAASALARIGDVKGLGLLHRRLQPEFPPHVRREALNALRTVRDTASIAPVVAVAGHRDTPDDLRRAALEALQAYGSVPVWRAIVDTASRAPALRASIVAVADSVALSDSVVQKVVGDWAIALLDRGDDQHAHAAMKMAAHLRPHDAVRALVKAVSTSEIWGPAAAQELVRLTGVDSAPAADPWSPEGRRAAQQFWDDWWTANATRYVVVSPDVGHRAYDAWYERIIRQRKLERARRSNPRRGN